MQQNLMNMHRFLSCPIRGLNRPTGFQEVKAPRFLDIDTWGWLVVSLTHRLPLPTGLTWYSFLEAESNPRAHGPDGCHGKAPATPGIDPGTFRIVAQCLNHYATPGPYGFSNKVLFFLFWPKPERVDELNTSPKFEISQASVLWDPRYLTRTDGQTKRGSYSAFALRKLLIKNLNSELVRYYVYTAIISKPGILSIRIDLK
jgi:hypothetical protein